MTNPREGDTQLHKIIENIHCAVSSDDASYHLQELQNKQLFPPGLPSELYSNKASQLQATTLDKALAVLAESAKIFPSNKHLIEKTVVQWNFCGVIDNDNFYDHYRVKGQTKRLKSNATDNHSWPGFRAFGLLPATSRTAVFDFTSPYISTTISSYADRELQKTYIRHCLPHPDNEHLYRDFGRNFISRIAPHPKEQSPFDNSQWKLVCKREEPVITENKSENSNNTSKPPETLAVTTTSSENSKPTTAAALDQSYEKSADTLPEKPSTQSPSQNSLLSESTVPSVNIPVAQLDTARPAEIPATQIETPATLEEIPASQLETTSAKVKVPASQIESAGTTVEIPASQIETAGTTAEIPASQIETTPVEIPAPQKQNKATPAGTTAAQEQLPSSVAVQIPDTKADNITEAAPVAVIGPWSGTEVVTTKKKKPFGLSGSISLSNRSFQAENTTLNFSVSYKPIQDSYWFIRSGATISADGKLNYTWGVGYDDWHPGTWALQLNHWGPLEPGDGLDVENAVAQLSHKFKHPWLTERSLSSSIGLSSPLSSDPSLSWGASWNPYKNWFIRSTLVKPLRGSGLNWSYGFGYTRYSNNSLSFEYNNWGLNKFPDHNFKENGLISLIYRWAF